MNIDQNAIHGEAGTGFEKRGSKGPFECGNCRYFNGACTQKIMRERSKEPRDKDGDVVVSDRDCCEYIERGKVGYVGK